MTPDNTEIIFNELPDRLKSVVTILSVPPSLTKNTAEKLLQHSGYANGNASEVVNEIKSFPVWIQRNRINWAIDDELREIALKKLNGSSLKFKKESLNILKEYQPNLEECSYNESKDFQLQIARLALSIPGEREHAIVSLRSFFEAAELFNNHESSRVISAYIDESLGIDTFQKHYSESTLSAFFMRGLHAYRSKDNRTALKYLIPVWKKRGNSFSAVKDAAIAAHLVGLIYKKERSRFEEAEKAYLESLKLGGEINHTYHLTQVYHSLGNLYTKNRRFEDAENAYIASIELKKEVNDKYGLAQVYHSLGNLYTKNRRFEDAENAYLESIELKKEVNDKYGLAQVYHSLGNLYTKDRRFEDAKDAYKQSIELGKVINDKYTLAQVYHDLGNLNSKERSRFKEADDAYRQSLELLEAINDKYGLAQVYHSLGNLYSKDRSRFDEAEEAYHKSLWLEKENNNKYGLAQVYHNLGNLYSKDRNRYKDAERAFENSLIENKKINDRVGLAQVFMNFGKLKISQKQYKEAHNLLTESLKYEKNNRYREIIKQLIRDLPT